MAWFELKNGFSVRLHPDLGGQFFRPLFVHLCGSRKLNKSCLLVGEDPLNPVQKLALLNFSRCARSDLGFGGVIPVGVRVPPFAPFVFNELRK